jgi:hypothetical protein
VNTGLKYVPTEEGIINQIRLKARKETILSINYHVLQLLNNEIFPLKEELELVQNVLTALYRAIFNCKNLSEGI